MSFRSPVPLLDRYVLRESLLPFILGFSLVTFLFVMDFLFDYLDLILSKGIPPLVVGELFLLALGWITALSFPCGVLVAALMTFGRMAQDNEITALRGLGVNLARVLRAELLADALLGVLLGLFNNYVLPETNHRFANLSLSIHRKSPTARIEAGVFINDFDNYSLLVRKIDHRTGAMTDVTIYDYTQGKTPTTILAKHGTMKYIDHGATLRLELENGEVHEVPGEASEGKYRRLAFDRQTIYLHNAGATLRRTDRRARGEREMNVPMMRAEIRKLEQRKRTRVEDLEAKASAAGYASLKAFLAARGKSGPASDARADSLAPAEQKLLEQVRVGKVEAANIERRIDSFEVEIHKKFSIPFACIVFVLLGGPLGIRMHKGGFANMAIAVVFFLIYYLFLLGGEQLADRRLLSPALAMWAPNILLGGAGIYLTASILGLGPSRGMR